MADIVMTLSIKTAVIFFPYAVHVTRLNRASSAKEKAFLMNESVFITRGKSCCLPAYYAHATSVHQSANLVALLKKQ